MHTRRGRFQRYLNTPRPCPKTDGRPILCAVCGKGGGTLVKVENRYVHKQCWEGR